MKYNIHIQQPIKDGAFTQTKRALRMALMCLVCCLTVLCSCSKEKHEDEPQMPEDEGLRRTVLVYMVANNSLNSYGRQDRKEMLKAASEGAIPKDCDMLLYFLDYTNKPALYRITDADSLERLVDYPETTPSVSAQRMLDVIDDAKRISPAKEYGMVLWSHASGWFEDGLNDYHPSARVNSGSSDVTTYSFGATANSETMNITTLAQVLEGQDMDFLYFDCCYMASVEALYELRNVTKQVYASVAEMHVDGSRWDLCTQDLFTEGKADLVKAAQRNFEYYDTREGNDRTYTGTVVNMEHLQELADICAEIYAQAPSPKIPSDCFVQNYGYNRAYRDAFYDLTDYMKVLAFDNEELFNKYNQCMDKVIAYKAATPCVFSTLKIESHCGLSVNIITTLSEADTKNYRNLQWFNDVTKKLNF